MIRLSKISDLNQIIELWHNVFGDTEEEIRFFCRYNYKPENTVVCEIDKKIVSSLFLLEGKMSIECADSPAYYLYAACTDELYRGRGIMSQMLDFAKETAFSRNVDFICLKPATPHLYNYYEKSGYKTVFYNKKVIFDKSDVNKSSCIDLTVDNNENNFSELRDNAFNGNCYFKWDNNSVKFAFSYHEMYGGKRIKTRKGYSLYNTNKGILYVKEITFTYKMMAEFINFCFKNSEINSIEMYLPVWTKTTDKYEIIPSGMMLATNNKSVDLINKIDNSYLGLTLD